MPPVDVLKDAEKFGKTVGAARGSMDAPYDKKVHFAKLIGTSLPTLRRMEEGAIGTIGATTEERRQLAERIIEKAGALPEWFGLSEPTPKEVDQLRRDFADEMDAMKTELLEEIEAVRLAQASAPPIPKPGEGG